LGMIFWSDKLLRADSRMGWIKGAS